MKRFITLGLVFLAVVMVGCNGETPPTQPTPTAVVPPTETPAPPTETPIPPTATPVPPTPTPTATAIPIAPTSDPNVESYRLAKSVGVNQIAYSEAWPKPRHGGVLDQFTTKELFDELGSYGINAVRLWLSVRPDDGFNGPPVYEDMREVWGHPDIDTIVVLFTHPAFYTAAEPGCRGGDTSVGWEINEPTYEIATFLYENFGDQPKTIIFTEQEVDNMARGYDCTEPTDHVWHMWEGSTDCRLAKSNVECAMELTEMRWAAALERAENRQRAVMQARAEHPDAQLMVGTSITISQFEDSPRFFGKSFLKNYLPGMDPSADWVGMSQGASGGRDFSMPIQQVKLYTGYPTDRLFVDQVYVNEKYPGVQYNLIAPAIRVAFNWDVQQVFIWMWKQGWRSYNDRGQPENKGMWQWANEQGVPGKVVYGDPTSGMDVIRELHPGWIEPTPTPETPVDTPTPKPTATPEETPTPEVGLCDHCPAQGSIGCTINYPLCVRCWEDCGEPIATPTPAPPTPTPTPTGGVILPTPTPAPGDCSHCAPPGSIGCTISYVVCVQCWADCGHPIATPTPRPPTPTPTPNDTATLSMTKIEGTPTHCTWVATHQESGLQVSKDFPDCSKDIHVTFSEVGMWSLEVTVHYAHGYNGQELNEEEGWALGDLDEDGLYEYRTYRMIEVTEAPEVPITG